ncbi:2-oxoglutarate dehydrogenase-like enzyme [Trinickia symbiotica]|nr:thiamine pyrophosphate-dependent enzyme [Trinickia symbiotica]PPK41654.1 2-oxoglutarate dehydrogenase-like enzyme [Trinickia symbiotica]
MLKEGQSSFLFGGNAPYVEEQYETYLADPNAVTTEWRAWFDALRETPAIDGSDRDDEPHAPVISSFVELAAAEGSLEGAEALIPMLDEVVRYGASKKLRAVVMGMAPRDTRSSFYTSDVAKMIEAPVLHVNGDDPEAVAMAVRLALDYRTAFKRSVVIDLVCFRKYGHQEQDTP